MARLVPLLAVVCLLVAVPVALADPTPFSSTSGTCQPGTGTSNWSTTALTGGDESLYDLRVTTDGGPADFNLDTDTLSWADATTDWSIWQFPDGTVPSGTITCGSAPGDLQWTITWSKLPHPPVSFSGKLLPGNLSDLGFDAPEDGVYAVDVTMTSGRATLYANGDPIGAVTSTAHVELPADGGFNSLTLQDHITSPAQYTVAISELPVTMTPAPTAVPGYGRPGVGRTYGYHLSVPATVNVWVRSSTGNVIRKLVDTDPEEAGDHSVIWDGRDAGGVPLPDGRYTLSFGAFNQAGSASQDLLAGIDGAPPTISTTNLPGYTYRFSSTDSLSGLASFLVTVDGKPAPVTKLGGATVMSSTVSRLAPGSHAVHVVATDNAGNVLQRDMQVIGTPLAPPPACNSGLNYIAAVLNARHFASAVGRLVETVPSQVLQRFTIHKALCTDLTGDGVADLALMLKGRGDIRFHTPIALFKGVPGKFSYVYGDSHASYRSMSRSGRDVVLRPSHGKSRVLHWNGKRFAVRRAR